jgi:integrase
MTKRRGYREGQIVQRGENTWLLRYRIEGKRLAKTIRGTKAEALKALRELQHAGDRGEHVEPDKMTVEQWIEHWLASGCPGNKNRKAVGQRSAERYAQLLRRHVLPSLGARPLQKLQATEIDALYVQLEGRIAPGTAKHLHVVLGACIGTAARTRKIARNPMLELAKIPSRGEADHGTVLEQAQLSELVRGFKGSSIFPIVAVAAFTGARRNEILALQWDDLDLTNKTLRIERALEKTDKHGLRFKGPKSERGKRTITIDDNLVSLLLAERDKHLRIIAGVGDDAQVDLSLVKLPPGALMFPTPGTGQPRSPDAVSKQFIRGAAKLGFRLRFHDLRGTYETLLLNNSMAARCGHDPATMLRAYAKRTTKADTDAARVIGNLFKGAL